MIRSVLAVHFLGNKAALKKILWQSLAVQFFVVRDQNEARELTCVDKPSRVRSAELFRLVGEGDVNDPGNVTRRGLNPDSVRSYHLQTKLLDNQHCRQTALVYACIYIVPE